MICEKHPGETITEHCSGCGADLCDKCLTRCIGIGEMTLCPDCAPDALRNNIEEAENAKKMAFKAVFVSVALMIVGCMAAYVAYTAGGQDAMFAATLSIVLFFGLARLYSVSMEVRATRQKLTAMGLPLDGLTKEALAKVIMAILFGAFIAPWTTLRLLAITQHADKEIKNSQALLDEYSASRAERRRRG